MAYMSPAAYDSWWRARIAREDNDHANHILKHLQLKSNGGSSINPITQELTLNSLGAPQFIASKQWPAEKAGTGAAAADRQVSSSSSNNNQHFGPQQLQGNLPAAGSTAVATHDSGRQSSRATTLVGTSAKGDERLAAADLTAQASLAEDSISTVSRATYSSVSRTSRATKPAAARSVVSSRARSDVSYPRTPDFSAVGSSVADFEVMSRLARLEADLAQEKKKREAAEAEMRQLLASRAGC